jgi:hypothetical protein
MSTPVSYFRESIRVMIGDNDPDIKMRDDAQIDAAVRLVVDLGKVTGAETNGYAMNLARTEIAPTLTPATDPKAFAQVIYHAAKQFAVDVTPTAWRTRAFSESIGENRERIFSLLNDIYTLEHGDGCQSADYPE